MKEFPEAFLAMLKGNFETSERARLTLFNFSLTTNGDQICTKFPGVITARNILKATRALNRA